MRPGDADPDTSVTDRVVTPARLRPVPAPAHDDVEPARAQSGVPANVHGDARPARHQGGQSAQ